MVRTTVAFQMRNVTGEKQKFRFDPKFNHLGSPERPEIKFSALRFYDWDGKVALNLGGNELKLTTRRMRQELETVPAIEVPPEKEIKIIYVHEAPRRLTDMETWQTLQPADGIHLRLILGDADCSNLQVHAESAHRADPVLVSVTEDGCKFYEWTIENYLLPGQGVEVYWHPPTAEDQKP